MQLEQLTFELRLCGKEGCICALYLLCRVLCVVCCVLCVVCCVRYAECHHDRSRDVFVAADVVRQSESLTPRDVVQIVAVLDAFLDR